MKEGTSFKHLTWHDRILIEKLILKGYHKKEIAEIIGCSLKTIYNELKRGQYEHTNYDWTTEMRYSPDIANEKYRKNLKCKGTIPKLQRDSKLRDYIENLIVKLRYSPEAIIYSMKKEQLDFDVNISSVNTIYSGIRKGYFNNITMAALPRRGIKIKRKKHIKIQKILYEGTSIDKRPEEVNDRETFGHWEMDCVVGRVTNKKTLLVLTERKTRFEIIETLKESTTAEVIKAINRLEKKCGSDFYKLFKTITVDNGHEFRNYAGIEKAQYRKKERTNVYYCHAYAPHERGSNENQNIFIRRFYPKGSDFDKVIFKNKIKELQFWINSYPRRLFDGNSSMDKIEDELISLGCRRKTIEYFI